MTKLRIAATVAQMHTLPFQANGLVTGGFTTIGYGWNIYTWIF